MAPRDHVSNPLEVPRGTLIRVFLEAVDRHGAAPALSYWSGGAWRSISYLQVFDQVRRLAGGLRALGLERGDRAAILSENRPEWALADYACLCAGIVDVPIYATLVPEQIAYLLRDSGARLVFVSTWAQLEKVMQIRDRLPALEHIVVFDVPKSLPPGVRTFEALLSLGVQEPLGNDDGHFRQEALRAAPDDVATLIYTSGTTGEPKGVMLTHNNMASNIHACEIVLAIGTADVALSLLPLSHALQRMVDYLLFHVGCCIAYARSLESVPQDMVAVRPSLLVGAPRLYEKFYGRVMATPGVRGKLVRWAKRVGDTWAEDKLAGRRPGFFLALRHAVADRLVFRKVRAGAGGRIRFFVSGSAPLAPAIIKFFYGAGMTILEGYGLTETSPVTNVNTFQDYRIGTVGKPIPGTEERIAEDGEILIRGPQVMRGYYRRPEDTRKALDPDGWLHTGDIGEIDEDGFLRITDRKKDLIVTAGGKKIAPQPVENRVKRNRFVDQVVMVGDRRKFAALLVVPNFETLGEWARAQGISYSTRRELISDPRVQQFTEQEVLGELSHLARFEMPKKIALLEQEFTIERGDLTPTLKVKRPVVEERYGELIDSFYEADEAQTVFVG
ncbi:MAG: long-chain fatty acid--CoA ligase [Gemmatimonadetes bacterium]|nr:long-chain fatty acid--CoA ligase [Gemmatimonadota bacterium]